MIIVPLEMKEAEKKGEGQLEQKKSILVKREAGKGNRVSKKARKENFKELKRQVKIW